MKVKALPDGWLLVRLSPGDAAHARYAERLRRFSEPDDYTRAERLLQPVVDAGIQTLSDLTRKAIGRQGGPRAILKASRLFGDGERRKLAESLRDTLLAGELLGRARIRLRLQQAEQAQEFSDHTDFRAFDDGPLQPLAPPAALDYFRSLVPGLDVDLDPLAAELGKRAFELAATTDEVTLQAVKDVILEKMKTGENISSAPDEIKAILDGAGVGPVRRSYAENVWRTSAMTSYNEGAQTELEKAKDFFPAWMWSNPRDGRSRPRHARLHGSYFPATQKFTDVRGDSADEVCQCRCVPIPVYRRRWEELQAQGATFAESWD